LEKDLKSPAQYQAETGMRLEPTGRGGLPRAVGRNAGWAMAWQPGPAGLPACCARQRDHHAQTVRGTTRWRALRRLGGGSTVATASGLQMTLLRKRKSRLSSSNSLQRVHLWLTLIVTIQGRPCELVTPSLITRSSLSPRMPIYSIGRSGTRTRAFGATSIRIGSAR
jgi:hypothetical protein